jgi:hypothetical protein
MREFVGGFDVVSGRRVGASRHNGAWMSLFDWLLVGHLVGDFLLQTDSMARYKAQSWGWMLKHVVLYVAVMAVVLGAYALSHPVPLWMLGLALLFIGATHIVLDRRGFTLRWMRLIGITSGLDWLIIVADQVFHVLVLVVVVQVVIWAGR